MLKRGSGILLLVGCLILVSAPIALCATSNIQYASHKYYTPGLHNVDLTVTNAFSAPQKVSTIKNMRSAITTPDNVSWNASNMYPWVLGNTIELLSGGGSSFIKDSSKKYAIKFVAPANKSIINMTFLPDAFTDKPGPNGSTSLPVNLSDPYRTTWNIGIQADNGGVPSGVYLVNASLRDYTNEIWTLLNFKNSLKITQGSTYWIVMQYQAGKLPNSKDNYFGVYASVPAAIYTGDAPYPLNSVNPDINARYGFNAYQYANSVWHVDTLGRTLPCFVLGFSDGSVIGNPFRHNYISAYGSNLFSEKIVPTRNYTVNILSAPFNVRHPQNMYVKPADNLYYSITRDSPTGNVVSSGTFLTKNRVYVSGLLDGETDRRWYNSTLSNTVTLNKGSTYYITFRSPGSNNSAVWDSDAGNPITYQYWDTGYIGVLAAASYGGSTDYCVRTTDNWRTTISYPARDLAFLLGYN